ncbi:histone-lysine N-methyltransferase SETMAR [Trichonephila clavipes]|nr:histone-lysine N-methyltransferase SETMAR [Trichonephila clavipes]
MNSCHIEKTNVSLQEELTVFSNGNLQVETNVVKIARRLRDWSRSEARAVIRFLWVKNVSTSTIHSQIAEVYGEEAMLTQNFAKWCHSFQSGGQDVKNSIRVGSGRPSSSTTEINTTRIEEMIQND